MLFSKSVPLFRLIALITSLSLILPSLVPLSLPSPAANAADKTTDKVTRAHGAPSQNLPNLNNMRGRKEPEPKKHTPVPAKRCRHWDKQCKELKEMKAFNQFVPEDDGLRGRIAMAGATDAANVFDWRSPLSTLTSPFSVSAFDGRAGRLERPVADIPVRRAFRSAPEAGGSKPRMTPDGKRPLPHAFASSLLPVVALQEASDLYTARVQPHYRTGQPGEDLLSGNFHWSIPVINLPGRAGHDLNLTLSYDSLLWTKSGSTINYDIGFGWPGPGFRFGFPVFYGPYVNSRTGRESYILYTPSGEVVELRKRTTGELIYESEDSAYTHFKYDYAIGKYVLTASDGTRYIYGTTLEIKDRNGNLITVTFNTHGSINTITDTLGRVFYFTYNFYDDLQSIYQYWNGLQRTIASFSYADLPIYYNFSGATPDNIGYGQVIPVLSEVYLLGGTLYKFQYNTYGQVKKIERYGNTTFLRNWMSFNLPQDQSSGAQTDCPRFTARTDWAYEWSAPSGVTTNYQFFQSAANPDAGTTEPSIPTLLYGQATTADGVTHKEFYYPDPAGSAKWRYGLMKMSETWTDGNTRVRKRAKLKYEQPCGGGSYNNWLYQCNPRVIESNIYDNTDTNNNTWENTRRRTITYTPPYQGIFDFNLPADVYEYDSNGTTVLRRRHTDYNLSSTYVDRRIIGLPSMRTLYGGAGALASKVEYIYDEASSVQAHSATPVYHDTNYGTGFVAGRGNVTTVRRYNVDNGSYLQSKINYYLTGTVANTSELHEPGEQDVAITTFNYDGPFYNILITNTFAFPTTVTDPDNFSSTIRYDYFNSAVARTTNPKGAAVLREYNINNRLFRVTNEVTGAYARYEYEATGTFVSSYTTIQEGKGEFFSQTFFDGHDRVRAVITDHPDRDGSVGAGRLSAVWNAYDAMGRLAQRSKPTEINGYWAPDGDDAYIANPPSGGWIWSFQAYDWKGRPTVTTNERGNTTIIDYNGCACAGGLVTTIQDEGQVNDVGGVPTLQRRKTQIIHDALGREKKRVAYNWDGTTVYTSATTTYNVRDQEINVKRYKGDGDGVSCPTATCQEATTSYDGHGRVSARRLPQDDGDTTYTYYNNGLLQTSMDARGATGTFTYNNRGLMTGANYTGGGVETPSVSFEYDELGNPDLMDDGPGYVDYNYNNLGQLTSETRHFDSLSGMSFPISYGYNLAGQLKRVTDPRGDEIYYGYNTAGSLISVTGSSFAGVTNYATGFQYRAWGQPKHVAYGDSFYADIGYDVQMKVTSFNIPGVLGANYTLNENSLVRSSQSLIDSRMDRIFDWDHMGRITKSLTTGSPLQFQQYYGYDEYGHLTSRSGNYWNTFYASMSASYSRERAVSTSETDSGFPNPIYGRTFQYDAMGNNTQVTTTVTVNGQQSQPTVSNNLYDAVGRPRTQGTELDGYGRVVKVNPGYDLISTPFGGQVLNILDSNGQKLTGKVYVGTDLLAEQKMLSGQPSEVIWHHRDPMNTVSRDTKAGGWTDQLYMVDPMGATLKPATATEIQTEMFNQGCVRNPHPGCSGQPPVTSFYTPNSGTYSSNGVLGQLAGGCNAFSGAAVSCGNQLDFFSRMSKDMLQGYEKYAGMVINAMYSNIVYSMVDSSRAVVYGPFAGVTGAAIGGTYTFKLNEEWVDTDEKGNELDKPFRRWVVEGEFLPGGGPGQGQQGGGGGRETDCSRFVNSLVETIEWDIDFSTPASFLFNTTWVVGHSLLDQAGNHSSRLGHADHTAGGFQRQLTDGGQNDGVYQHVLAHAGAIVIGDAGLAKSIQDDRTGNRLATTGAELTNFALQQDEWQRDNAPTIERWLENIAEVKDDRAGRAIGKDILKHINGKMSKEQLRSAIFSRLCDP
jgi:YD repeat-containing protein